MQSKRWPGRVGPAREAAAGSQTTSSRTSPATRAAPRPAIRRTSARARIRTSSDRSIARTRAAEILADRGYRIQQNPTREEVAAARAATGDTGRERSKPDYLLEGRVFDCYSPGADKPVRGVWYEVGKKIKKNQTQRVVVNLEDWEGDVAALRKQFDDWPIDRLREVKAITPDGRIIQLVPRQDD